MEININELTATLSPSQHGLAWPHALEYPDNGYELSDTQMRAWVDYAKGWGLDELPTCERELTAMFIQHVCTSWSDSESDDDSEGGNVFRCDKGELYIYIGE